MVDVQETLELLNGLYARRNEMSPDIDDDGEKYSRVIIHHMHDQIYHEMGGEQPSYNIKLEPTGVTATGPTGVPQEALYSL